MGEGCGEWEGSNLYENNIIGSHGGGADLEGLVNSGKSYRDEEKQRQMYAMVLANNVGKYHFYEMVGMDTKIQQLEELLIGEEVKIVSEDAIIGILGLKEKRLGSNSLRIWNKLRGV